MWPMWPSAIEAVAAIDNPTDSPSDDLTLDMPGLDMEAAVEEYAGQRTKTDARPAPC